MENDRIHALRNIYLQFSSITNTIDKQISSLFLFLSSFRGSLQCGIAILKTTNKDIIYYTPCIAKMQAVFS